MSERCSKANTTLLQINLLHHYWLDDGATVFDQIADPQKKANRLQNYDKRSFLAVRPTVSTANLLAANHCKFMETATGLTIAAPLTLQLPSDTVLQFIVSIAKGEFANYTAMTMRRQNIVEIFYPPEKTLYRFKENVPVLSNLTGAAIGSGSGKVLYLSQNYPAPQADDGVESLVISGTALLQLTSDNPGAVTQQLNASAAAAPIYMHQGDVPVITAPAGMTGAPAKGVRLSADVADDVFVLLKLQAVRADDDAFSFVDVQGKPRAAPPIYQVRFKNRSTYWRYVNKTSGAVVSTEPDPLALTFYGNANSDVNAKNKPKPYLVSVTAEKNGAAISKLISEIYI